MITKIEVCILLTFKYSKLSFPNWSLNSNENKKIMLLKQKAALIEQGGTVFQTKAYKNRNCFKKKKMDDAH